MTFLIEKLSDTNFTPREGNVILFSAEDSDISGICVLDNTGSQFRLTNGFIDYLENDRIHPYGDSTDFSLKGAQLNDSYIKFFDEYAFLGRYFNKNRSFYIKISDYVVSPETTLLFIGNESNHLRLFITNDGYLCFQQVINRQFETNTVKSTISLSDGDSATIKLYFDLKSWWGDSIVELDFYLYNTELHHDQLTLTLVNHQTNTNLPCYINRYPLVKTRDHEFFFRQDYANDRPYEYSDNGDIIKMLVTVEGDSVHTYSHSELYPSALGGGHFSPDDNNIYYLELTVDEEHFTTQLGFIPTTCFPKVLRGFYTQPLGVYGWAISTQGRKFAKKGGWGDPFTYPEKLPVGSIIGIKYQPSKGTYEVFVNGTSKGCPFPEGTIIEPVIFGVSFLGGETNGLVQTLGKVSVHKNFDSTKGLPFPKSLDYITTSWISGMKFRIHDLTLPYTQDRLADQEFVYPLDTFKLLFEHSDGTIYDGTDFVLSRTKSYVKTTIPPDLKKGNYVVYITKGYPEIIETNKVSLKIDEFTPSDFPLSIDFTDVSESYIHQTLMAAHKQWGGLNGGVIVENITLNEEGLKLKSLGDKYDGHLRGVDILGNTTNFTTRMGACVVTKRYYGPGTYEVECTLPKNTGVCSAFWTFHYEEAYKGSPAFKELVDLGLHPTGTPDSGVYCVRNHEIDIEVPSALKDWSDQQKASYTNAKFNAWWGDQRNWDVPESDPNYWSEYNDTWKTHNIPINDGNVHKFRFDWHLLPEPHIDFYIDDIYQHTCTKNVPFIAGQFWFGMWFPSSPGNHWAGLKADFREEQMLVKKLTITPFQNEYSKLLNVGQTYPKTNFLPLFYSRTGKKKKKHFCIKWGDILCVVVNLNISGTPYKGRVIQVAIKDITGVIITKVSATTDSDGEAIVAFNTSQYNPGEYKLVANWINDQKPLSSYILFTLVEEGVILTLKSNAQDYTSGEIIELNCSVITPVGIPKVGVMVKFVDSLTNKQWTSITNSSGVAQVKIVTGVNDECQFIFQAFFAGVQSNLVQVAVTPKLELELRANASIYNAGDTGIFTATLTKGDQPYVDQPIEFTVE